MRIQSQGPVDSGSPVRRTASASATDNQGLGGLAQVSGVERPEASLELASTHLSSLWDLGRSGLDELRQRLLDAGQVVGESIESLVRRIGVLRETEPTDGTKPAPADDGGPPWTEVRDNGQLSYRYRTVTEPDDCQGAWTEYDIHGRRFKTREVTENGQRYSETIEGNNRYRYRLGGADGLAAEAREQGHRTLTVHGHTVNVYGNAEPQLLANLQQALEEIPPEVARLATNLYISQDLGRVSKPDLTEMQPVAGIGGPNLIILDRQFMGTLNELKYVLYHELGHAFDHSHEPSLSGQPPWGQGGFGYASRSASEDFAEAFREVLTMWPTLQGLDAAGWASMMNWDKRHRVYLMLGGQAPSYEEIAAAAESLPPLGAKNDGPPPIPNKDQKPPPLPVPQG